MHQLSFVRRNGLTRRLTVLVRAALLVAIVSPALPCSAQVTPAASYTPPDDTPAIKVGATLFADYTVLQTPKIKDADGNDVTSNSFNVGRA